MGCEIGQITNENATRPFVECAICWVYPTNSPERHIDSRGQYALYKLTHSGALVNPFPQITNDFNTPLSHYTPYLSVHFLTHIAPPLLLGNHPNTTNTMTTIRVNRIAKHKTTGVTSNRPPGVIHVLRTELRASIFWMEM